MSADFRFKSREWFKGAPLRAAVAAETAKAVRAFDAAAKKVQKTIAAIASGDKAAEKSVLKAVYSLDDRMSKPEIRGNREAYVKCNKVADALRKSVNPAIEAGELARSAERDRQRLALVTAEQDAKYAGRSHRDVVFRQYEDELAIARGRR
jgi:hypothetical protein